MKKTKLDSQAIPSLDEIQRLYEDLLRREAGEEKRDGGQKTGEFLPILENMRVKNSL